INVANALSLLKQEHQALVVCGKQSQNQVETLLKKENINYQLFLIDGIVRTNTKVIDDKNNLTEINEKGPVISYDTIKRIIHYLNYVAKPNDILVISGRLPQGLNDNTYYQICEQLKNQYQIILDCDGEPLKEALSSKISYIKPNLFEFGQLINNPNQLTNTEIIQHGKKLISQHHLKMIIISSGSLGALYITSENHYFAKAINITVDNTVGCGDYFVGALCYSITNENDIDSIIKNTMAISALKASNMPTNYDNYQQLRKQVNYEQSN
ncbi:MAG: PfkB family carbohydrate kinase, partial [Erysipelotrichaceae bacterium]